MSPSIESGRLPALDELLALYDSVGWSAYTRDPVTLSAAVAGSSYVVTAWDGSTLVGLARTVSDGVSICYVQDVVVRPDRQRAGIGRALVDEVLHHYAHVRQVVLMTDDETRQAQFYTALGFTQVGTGELSALRCFVRLA